MTTDHALPLSKWSVEKLSELYSQGPSRVHGPGDVAWAADLLIQRGIELPGQKPRDDAKYPSKVVALPAKTNVVARHFEHGKLELHFPKDGFMEPDQFEFKDRDELQAYLAKAFHFPATSAQRASFSRKGRYQRIDDRGNPIFTFGDPILDLITNRHGLTIVAGEVFDFRSKAITEGGLRGGRLGMNLTPHIGAIQQMLLAESMAPKGGYELVECSAKGMTFASRNPSTMMFTRSSGAPGLLTFRAWRTNAWFYWSLGTEIYTLGPEFSSARIESKYGDHLGNSNTCGVLKRDSDSDTNDDYVDEWEAGGFSDAPAGHQSRCEAHWGGDFRSGTVRKGTCGSWQG
jgi:hypothetical protein